MRLRLAARKLDLLVALLAALLVYGLGLFVKGPMIQPDEGSYLANAAALAGFDNDLANSYHAGYSLFIAPAFLIADSPDGVWALVKAINSALFFVSVWCLIAIARQLLPEISHRDRLIGVTLASLYPMWVVMAGYSFSENAFVPVFLLACLTYLRCIRDQAEVWPWLMLGLIVGFLYWIHPKAVAVLIAAGVGGIYIAARRKMYFQYVVFVLGTALMIYAYRNGLAPWLQGHMTSSGAAPNLHYPSAGKLLTAFLTAQGLKSLVAHIGGHVFYLAVGSLGLLVVGVLSLASKIRWDSLESPDNLFKYRAIAIFLGLSFIGTLAISVLLFTVTTEAVRLDTWMYGRYVEGVIAPILLLGALAPSFRGGLWAVAIAAFSVVLLNFGITEYAHTAPFNVSTFWQEFFLREQGLWVWLGTGCALVILASVIPRHAAMLVIGLTFGFSTILQVWWHAGHADVANRRIEAANFIRANYPPGTCVGFSQAGITNSYKHTFWFDFGFALFDYDLKRMSFEKWYADCAGPLVSYEQDLEERGEVFAIAISPLDGPTVWAKERPRNFRIYPITVADRSVGLARMLGEGWYFFDQESVWSSQRAELKLPIPDDCRSGRCEAVLTFGVFGASESRPVSVIFKPGRPGFPELPTLVARSGALQHVSIPLLGGGSSFDVMLEIPAATSPHELNWSADKRIMGIALRSVDVVDMGAISYPVQVGPKAGAALALVLKDGWHSPEAQHVWSMERARLKLPVPDKCEGASCFAVIEFGVFAASEQRPVTVRFALQGGGKPWSETITAVRPEQTIAVPMGGQQGAPELLIEVLDATSPSRLGLSTDARILGIALRSVDMRPLNRTR